MTRAAFRMCAAGCLTTIPAAQVMCWHHWRRVPRPIQRGILRAWRHGHGEDSAEYHRQLRRALDSLAEIKTVRDGRALAAGDS